MSDKYELESFSVTGNYRKKDDGPSIGCLIVMGIVLLGMIGSCSKDKQAQAEAPVSAGGH